MPASLSTPSVKKQIVVLGGGAGGTIAANRSHRRLDRHGEQGRYP
jgi:hypothetical protein